MTDFSKIGKSNRNRGTAYERKIAHMLTDAFGVKFKRSPRSGALLREGSVNGDLIGGDLVCEKDFKFNIECKNCKNISLESVIKHPQTSPLIKYWCQCIYDARISSVEGKEKLPILFFNVKSIRNDLVCMPPSCINLMRDWQTNQPIHICIHPIKLPVKITMYNKIIEVQDIPSMIIMTINDFLQNIIKDAIFYG